METEKQESEEGVADSSMHGSSQHRTLSPHSFPHWRDAEWVRASLPHRHHWPEQPAQSSCCASDGYRHGLAPMGSAGHAAHLFSKKISGSHSMSGGSRRIWMPPNSDSFHCNRRSTQLCGEARETGSPTHRWEPAAHPEPPLPRLTGRAEGLGVGSAWRRHLWPPVPQGPGSRGQRSRGEAAVASGGQECCSKQAPGAEGWARVGSEERGSSWLHC